MPHEQKPEGLYYCPKCNGEMARDLATHMKEELPHLSVAMMAIEILNDCKCPPKILGPVWEWSRTYLRDFDGLSGEDKEKLKLIKWQEWARR